jgi:hypothetical protein
LPPFLFRGVQPSEPRGDAHEPWRKRIKYANVLQPRPPFLEQLEALVIEISLGLGGEPSDIAARAREALDQPAPNRIVSAILGLELQQSRPAVQVGHCWPRRVAPAR